MSRLTLLLASLTLAGCAGSSPWAGGSAQTVESEVTPAIVAASSLEDLLLRLSALPDVRIEEGMNPAFEDL
jgi:hypothetical protein